MQKFICENCGKEYTVDLSLGIWQKDNSQKLHTAVGVSPKRFCCYECGKAKRKIKILNKLTSLSAEEKEKRHNTKIGTKKKICSVCHKEYLAPKYANNHINFCSEKCKMIYKYNLPISGIRICEECGKSYYYEQGQGNWDKDNNKIWSKGNKNGKNKKYTVPSHKYCCFECGIKHKEKQRNITNLKVHGYSSPWQDTSVKEKMFTKMKANGNLFTSKPEKEIKEFVEKLGFKTDKFIIGDGKTTQRFEIDIYIPEKRLGIEFNGSYFHSINGKKIGYISNNYHYNKSKIALEKGIELIHIWEDQWTNQQSIIKDILKARLGAIDKKEHIYARQCEIKEISVKIYKEFCENNHTQGYRSAKVKLGLFYNDVLVQIASFSKTRNTGKAVLKNKEYEWEWVRGCPASNNIVVGGTSKLFKYFIKKYNPSSILCYADWNLFNGKGYKECGFEFDGYTGPDKFYIQSKPIKRINRNPHKYKEFKELVNNKKLWLCYGAGSLRFKWVKNITK